MEITLNLLVHHGRFFVVFGRKLWVLLDRFRQEGAGAGSKTPALVKIEVIVHGTKGQSTNTSISGQVHPIPDKSSSDTPVSEIFSHNQLAQDSHIVPIPVKAGTSDDFIIQLNKGIIADRSINAPRMRQCWTNELIQRSPVRFVGT